MGKIVAIGGGEMSKGETYSLDQYIVALAEKSNPKVLFIPTASEDAEGYIEGIKKYFGGLGCQVECLCLVTGTYTDEAIRTLIINTDIIYVGGGDTVRMMERWRERNVHSYLREAYEKGVVLSGISAGSICWFTFGHSDSDAFINEGQWDYVRAYGLGFIPAAHCPHYNEPGREGFDEMMQEESLPGIALEDQTAFVERDGVYSILKSNKASKAYLLKNVQGTLEKVTLEEGTIEDCYLR